MINALVSLNLRVVRGGVGTVATITKSIQLPNVYATDEGIATSLVLIQGQTISPELRIVSVDSEAGTVHLNMTHPSGVNLDKFIDGTTFDELAANLEAVGWQVEPNCDGLRALDEHNKTQSDRDTQKSVPEEELSAADYAKKHKLKPTLKHHLIFVIVFLAIFTVGRATISLFFDLAGSEPTRTIWFVISVILGCLTSIIGQRILTSCLVKDHRKKTTVQQA